MEQVETKVDVLATALRVTLTEYSTGIGTAIAVAVMDQPAGTYWIITDDALTAVAELIERNRAALKLLESVAPHHPQTADLRAALARVGGGK